MASTTNMVDPKKKKIGKFDKRLLDYIEHGEDDEAISMITENMCNVVDEYGSLLHYAANFGNERIARHLMVLGANADLRVNGKSPVMIAIMKGNVTMAAVLLNTSVEINNTGGQNSLLATKVTCQAMEALFLKIKVESSFHDELVQQMTNSKVPLVFAIIARDVELVKYMVDHGCDVNSRGINSMTPLQLAVFLEDQNLVEYLIDNGADVNAVDINGTDVLAYAFFHKKYSMVELLLHRGANPNGHIDENNQISPLLWTIMHSGDEEAYKCTELLLQQGADPQALIPNRYTIFVAACAYGENKKGIESVIAHLANLKALGTPIKTQTLVEMKLIPRFRIYYKLCGKMLKVKVWKSISILDLLVASDNKMEIYMRNKKLVSKLIRISYKRKLADDYPYYFNTMQKRISTASRLMRLKHFAALTISQVSDYNVFYTISQKIADYLDERSLQQVCELSVIAE